MSYVLVEFECLTVSFVIMNLCHELIRDAKHAD